MKDIKVLGSGCRNCQTTAQLIEDVAKAKGVAIALEKVEALAEIVRYGVMSTPGVVIDGQVVHAGGIPDRKQVEGWFAPTV
ncbi:thioredoxin family protein [uncultured Thiodictyon sp.]|uniref:thioredoxin family protein n=1 Tax=uncultured Thiodictyon sp. TaxID=1846217 RepID=UPI002600057A|nr:thioredoxin family protein [uncultured Thiodictyon sp.]